MLRPLNDFAKVLVSEKKFIKDTKDTSESGTLVSLPDKFNHYGMFSFAFEESFMNRAALDELYKYWEQYIGKKVFWLALSEKGAMLKEGDDTFVFMKLTSLIAVDDAESAVRNIHSDGAGSFNV